MSAAVKIAFGPLSAPKGSALVVFVGADMKPRRCGRRPVRRSRAAHPRGREGRQLSSGAQRTALDILAPAGLDASRLLVVGVAPGKDNAPLDFVMLGGFVFGKATGAQKVDVAFEAPAGAWDGAAAADFALGLKLRGYKFDKYKTRKKENGEENGAAAGVRRRLGPCGGGPRRRAGAVRGRRRRRARPRPRQRAAERAVSGGVRRPRQGSGEARGRRRRARREGDGAGSE